jgi:hypothetical protein
MHRLYLIARLVVESVIGMLCLSELLLLPDMWKERDHLVVALAQLLGAIAVVLVGVLCFKDVFKIAQILKGIRPSSSLK